MPNLQDLIPIRQKLGIPEQGIRPPNPLGAKLRQAWGLAEDTAREIPGAAKDLAKSSLQQTGKGFSILGKVLADAPTPEPTQLPGGSIAPGIDPSGMAGFTERVGAEGAKNAPRIFEGFTDLSTKLLEKLKGRSTVSRQFIHDLTNQPELKQTERDLIRSHLENEADEVNVPDFAEKVRAELLPLERRSHEDFNPNVDEEMSDYIGGGTPLYENIVLPDELRGPIQNYSEHVYESPIQTSAGRIHFGNTTQEPENYFGHTRVEDLPDDATRRVIEVQSDLFQKGRLENESKHIGYQEAYDAALKKGANANEAEAAAEKVFGQRSKDLSRLESYKNNAAHFRMIREEVKQAAKDGKTKLQFPTGETAMKIEGLGGDSAVWIDPTAERTINESNLSVGKRISRADSDGNYDPEGSEDWVITDVLGDGKFKAVSKRSLERFSPIDELNEEGLKQLDGYKETFDISGKVDTENPIYKFYEKEVGKYLKNQYGAQLITDPQGVKWWEVAVKPEEATKPVMAYGKAGLGTILGTAATGVAAAGPSINDWIGRLVDAMPQVDLTTDGSTPPTLPKKEAPAEKKAAETYTDPVRGVSFSEKDLKVLKDVLYAEISNRSQDKRQLESRVVINTALNRLKENIEKGRGPQTLEGVLSQRNQYQGYGSKEYQVAQSGKANAQKMAAIDAILNELKNGALKDNTNNAFYYIHNKDGSITYDDTRPLY